MAPNKTMNRALAISAALGAALFGISACTSTVTGSASPDPAASSASGGSSASSSSSSKSSGSSSSSSSSPSSSDSSSSASGGSGPKDPSDAATAPDEPFKYKNGVSVKLENPVPKDYDGVLSSEEGRAFPFTVTNPSDKTIDMSSYRKQTKVYCGDNFSNSEWIFKNAPEVGTPTIAPGATASYELAVAVKKTDFGSQCVVSIIFSVEGVSATNVDPAKFVVTVP